MNTNNTTRQAFNEFAQELKECVAGTRGWVDCSKSRADRMMLAHANLTVAAKSLGLVVERSAHNNRYIAHRAK